MPSSVGSILTFQCYASGPRVLGHVGAGEGRAASRLDSLPYFHLGAPHLILNYEGRYHGRSYEHWHYTDRVRDLC